MIHKLNATIKNNSYILKLKVKIKVNTIEVISIFIKID